MEVATLSPGFWMLQYAGLGSNRCSSRPADGGGITSELCNINVGRNGFGNGKFSETQAGVN
jgi:hypothetical protein